MLSMAGIISIRVLNDRLLSEREIFDTFQQIKVRLPNALARGFDNGRLNFGKRNISDLEPLGLVDKSGLKVLIHFAYIVKIFIIYSL